MQKPLLAAALLLAASIPVLWVTPAGAAVPKTQATATYACPGQPGNAD